MSGASRFARKFGAVTAAAAALLANSAAHAHETDILKGLLDRAVFFSVESPPSGVVLPPLVLTPDDLDADMMFAGHRSHSSHSSHRSHSSHSSHASSSIGGSRSPSRALDAIEQAPMSPVTPAKVTSSSLIAPGKSTSATSSSKGGHGYAPPAGINLENPEERFQLINTPRHNDEAKAYIKDLATGKSVLLEIGEKIGDYMLVEVDVVQETARLRKTGMKDVSLTKKSAKAK